ncbi:MAG: TIGR04372 family glycosyltransferase [Elusimicrobia bacterium]|nr:TIGR04372 family glycosyltransferase [Elusimicrobiota bacterium]
MKTLNRLVNLLNARGPFVFLTPCISVIGNCSEEILFGLIRARREGKKLIILYPFELPWKFRFPLTNREVFDLSSPHRADLPAPLFLLARLALTVVFGSFRALSLVLGKLLGRWAHLPGRFTHPTLGGTTLWKPDEEPAEFRWDVVERYRWTEAVQKPLTVGLRPEKLERARALAREMGIPDGAWFAGLHVREGGFYGDHQASACRNATIANYFPLIREITRRGGWVVRLGDKSMTPLPPMERVIDYPHTRFKSDLMDMHLLSACRFYVGMSSGILDTAFLFQRPMLIANMTNMTFVYPRRPEDRGLPKHVFSKSKGRFLSLREILEAPWEAQHFRDLGADFEMHENSPEELREAIVEFLDGLDRGGLPLDALQKEANRLRIVQGRRLLETVLFKPHYDDMHNRYRMASRLESAVGALSRSFVDANWERSSRTPASVGK